MVGTVMATVAAGTILTAALQQETIIEGEITRHRKEGLTRQDVDLKALRGDESTLDQGRQWGVKTRGHLKVVTATIDYCEKQMPFMEWLIKAKFDDFLN